MRLKLVLVAFMALLIAPRCPAPPPMVTGDVPTAVWQTFEWYLGAGYFKSDPTGKSWLLPATEMIYGVTDRQEINLVIAGVSLDNSYGVSDTVIGTKYQ